MGQKSNLLTLRKEKKVEITAFNSKLWVTLYKFLDYFNRLLFLKNVWITNQHIGIDTNFLYLKFKVYYRMAWLLKFTHKYLDLKVKKEKEFNSIYDDNTNFLSLFKKYTSSFNFNTFIIKFICLNKYINGKEVYKLSVIFKKYKPSMFARRHNLFIDFLRCTLLFCNNHIELSYYIKLWVYIFKYLSSRNHSRYLAFVKDTFTYILNFTAKKANKFKVKGIKFRLSGRINAKDRSDSHALSIGRVPAQTISKKVAYACEHVHTLYGVYGIKMWLYVKQT